MNYIAGALIGVGAVVLLFAVIRFILIGKAHHDRSGNSLFTPTFTGLEHDLMQKSERTLTIGLVGMVLSGAGILIHDLF